jgi:DNA-binding NarL/FixJ family response regulator
MALAPILIVDDHEVVRAGIRTYLAENSKSELSICGEASNGQEAMRAVSQFTPDVVILDLTMPDMNGFEVAAGIRELSPATKIVLFSIHQIPATARNVGADAFVAKSAGMNELLAAIESVLGKN